MGRDELRNIWTADGEAEVDTVEERTGELLFVGGDLVRSTGTFVVLVAEVATGAGVHGGDKHEVGGEDGLFVGARDGDFAVFEGLAEGFEDEAGVLGEFVKEEDAEVSKGNLSRSDRGTAADDGDGATGVVGVAEGTGGNDGVGETGEGVEFGDGDALGGGKFGEEAGGGAGEEGLSGSRRAREKEVVAASNGDEKSTFGESLVADIGEGGAV